MKWCPRCKQTKDELEFGRDKSRKDKLSIYCFACKELTRRDKEKKPPLLGARYKPAKDGDKIQARGRIKTLICNGLLPHPDTLPCVDCGDKERKHDYDHHKGYDAIYHEVVEAVCKSCHGKRTWARVKEEINWPDDPF